MSEDKIYKIARFIKETGWDNFSEKDSLYWLFKLLDSKKAMNEEIRDVVYSCPYIESWYLDVRGKIIDCLMNKRLRIQIDIGSRVVFSTTKIIDNYAHYYDSLKMFKFICRRIVYYQKYKDHIDRIVDFCSDLLDYFRGRYIFIRVDEYERLNVKEEKRKEDVLFKYFTMSPYMYKICVVKDHIFFKVKKSKLDTVKDLKDGRKFARKVDKLLAFS